jgi:hypothetical protein
MFGAITGYYFDGNGTHGFVRAAQGTITAFDVPGSTVTFPVNINDSGFVTGWYQDGSGNYIGFVRIP